MASIFIRALTTNEHTGKPEHDFVILGALGGYRFCVSTPISHSRHPAETFRFPLDRARSPVLQGLRQTPSGTIRDCEFEHPAPVCASRVKPSIRKSEREPEYF